MRPDRRNAAALAIAAIAASLLVACQSPPEIDETTQGCAPEGVASIGVSAEGELFSRPEVSFRAPLTPLTTERRVLIEGDGPQITPGAIVTIDFVALNGADGEVIETSGYGAAGVGHTVVTLGQETATPGLRRALLCAKEGSRVAAVVHPDDAVGDDWRVPGLGAGDPLVYVFDVLDVAGTRAEGEEREQADATLPVVKEQAGMPSIAVPAMSPPVELRSSTLIVGDGPAVRPGADVVIRHRSVLWRNGLTVSESWSEVTPRRLALNDLLPGVATSLVGETVGSRVLVVVPPEFGYGREGDTASSVTGTDTLVYVVDILATT